MNRTLPSPPMQRTDSQYQAARPEHHVWVSANAGTGKTRVLVDRIARLLLNGARPGKILCLTFTKTGAAEMAERIHRQLGEWVMMDDATLFNHLRALLNSEPREEDLIRARKLFAEVLDVPGGLNIRTIHAFCESVIGRFPIEAGVAPHFSVIEDRTATELLTQARDRILAQSVDQPDTDVARALSHLTELVNEDGFAKLMHDLTSKRAHLSAVLHHLESQGGIAEALSRYVGLGQDEQSREAILTTFVESIADAKLAQAAEALKHGGKTIAAKLPHLIAFQHADLATRIETFESDYVPLFLTAKLTPLSHERHLTTKKAREVDPELEPFMIAEQDRVFGVMEKLRARATVDATTSLLLIGQDMIQHYAELKTVHAYLDYDDLIHKTRALLQGQGAVSWVHYKLDGGIDHILVDESQDTSPDQWAIVDDISTEFFTGEGRHETIADTPRTIFAVGDEKQSIYSFQGADPLEFGRMRELFKSKSDGVNNPLDVVPLITSFRTTQAVIEMVNKVFAQPAASQGLKFDDQPIDHNTSRHQEAGLVELWPIIVPPKDEDDGEPWDVPLDYKNRRSPENILATKIASTIKRWLDNKDILIAENRPIRPSDILILVRKRHPFAPAMVRALKKNRVAVAGADRMVLTDQIAVMDLLSLGRFALTPQDDLSLAEVLKSPLVGLNEDAVFDLAHGRKGSLWAQLVHRKDSRADFNHAYDVLSRQLARADYMPPYEFFAGLLRDGAREALVKRLGPDAEDPIDEFLTLTLDFERNHIPSLQRFLHWVTQGGTEIKRDQETQSDQVRVMTVHGAKGLEAPIVFLADTCSLPGGQQDSKIQWAVTEPVVLWAPNTDMRCAQFTQWVDRAREQRLNEYRRLLYVAMTRAKERLYIVGYNKTDEPPEGSWYDLVRGPLASFGIQCTNANGDTVWVYETQQRIAPPEHKDKPVDDLADETLDWLNTPLPVEGTPPSPLTPSKPEPEAPPALGPFDDVQADRFKRGILIHKLLEVLPDLAIEQRAPAAQRWLAQPGHELDAPQQHDILHETFRVLDHPDFTPIFSTDSVAEVSLSGVIHERVVSARLDRLCITDDAVWVIDYKTNRPPPTDPSRVAEQYLRQMATYKALLARIYPRKQIRCLLLWTDGPHIMELNDEVLRAYAP